MTTGMPAARARAAASSLTTPSCIQMNPSPRAMAASTIGPTVSPRRKMSTRSTAVRHVGERGVDRHAQDLRLARD